MTDWNATRFDPVSPRGHVESHFLKLNDASGERALWLKATILRRLGSAPVAEAWAIAFDRELGHVAAKQVVPWASASFSREALAIRVAERRDRARAHARRARGGRRADRVGSRVRGRRGAVRAAAAAAVRGRHAGNAKIVSPHPDLRFSGHYRVGDRRVEVDGWRGMQGHNWGRRHTHLYGWVHCNVWEDADDLVVEGITARVKLGPLLSPPITLVIAAHAGERHHFTLPGSLWRARGRIAPRALRVPRRERDRAHRGSFSADTARLRRPPLREPRRRDDLLPELEDRATGTCGSRWPGGPRSRRTTRAAALEIGTRDPDHGVKMLA